MSLSCGPTRRVRTSAPMKTVLSHAGVSPCQPREAPASKAAQGAEAGGGRSPPARCFGIGIPVPFLFRWPLLHVAGKGRLVGARGESPARPGSLLGGCRRNPVEIGNRRKGV